MRLLAHIFFFLLLAFPSFGQTVGGAGWCKTSVNPNTITSLRVVNQRNMCSNVWDTLSRKMYYYDYALTVGSRWVEFVPLGPPIGAETKVEAGTGIGVAGNGTIATPYIITNTGDLSNTNEIQRVDSLSISGGVLYIGLLNDGVPRSSVTLPTADGSETKVNPGTAIGISGTGTTGSPYVVTSTADLSVTAGGTNALQIALNTSGQTPVFVKGIGQVTVTESATGDTIKIGGVGGIYGVSDTTQPAHVLAIAAASTLTFQSQGDNFGGVVPFRVLSNGTEPDIMGWYANGDSLTLSRSDTEFVLSTPAGLSVAAGAVLSLSGDSVTISTVGAALSTEKTYLQITSGNVVKYTEGIPLSHLNQSGATTGQVVKWSGTAWVPDTDAGVTDLTYSGTSSPVTINSSTGTDVTITAGTGISLAATSGNLTITNTGDTNPSDDITGSGTTNYLPKWAGSSALSNSVIYEDAGKIGIGTTTPTETLQLSSGGIKLPTNSSALSAQTLFYTNKDVLKFGAEKEIEKATVKVLTLSQQTNWSAGDYWDLVSIPFIEFGSVRIVMESSGDSHGSSRQCLLPIPYANDVWQSYGIGTTNDVWLLCPEQNSFSRAWGDRFVSQFRLALKLNNGTALFRLIAVEPGEIRGAPFDYGDATISVKFYFTENASFYANPVVETTSGTGMTVPTQYIPLVFSGSVGRSIFRNAVGIGEGYKDNAPPANGLIVQGYTGIGTDIPSERLHVSGNARVTGAYYDSNNDPGSSAQILSSTVTGTDWVSASTLGDNWGSQVVSTTGSTLDGNGTAGTPLKVNTGGIGPTELSSTSVTPASYTNANITVDADGRITSASNGTAGGTNYQTFKDDGVSLTQRPNADFISTATVTTALVDNGSNATEVAFNVPTDGITATQIAAGAVGASELSSLGTAGTYGSATQVPVFTTDADGRVSSVTNTIITGTLSGLTATRVPFASGAAALTDDANLTWNNTTKRLSVGNTGGSPSASVHIAEGSVASWEPLKAVGTVSGNMITTLSNAQNSGGASNNIVDLSVGGANAGDPMYRLVINGVDTWSIGVDNSDSDKLKIGRMTTPSTGSNIGITITADATPLIGINNDAPLHPLHVIGRATATVFQSIAGTPTHTFGTGAGTSPTLGSFTGTTNGIDLTFTTGTTPTANGNIVSITYPTAFSNTSNPVFCASNVQSATDIAKFYISAASASAFTLKANGTLAASTEYRLRFNISGR